MSSKNLFTFLSTYTPAVFGVGAMIMIASDVITLNLNTDYNAIHETISELILYPYGWIITVGMIILFIIHIFLSAVIFSSPAARCHRLVKLAGVLFALIALGFIVIMLFKTDPGDEIITLSGGIHVVVAAAMYVLFPVACGSLTIALWRHRKSESLIVFSVIITAVSLLIAYLVMPQNETNYIGAYERLLTLVNLSWLVMAGFRLPRLLNIC